MTSMKIWNNSDTTSDSLTSFVNDPKISSQRIYNLFFSDCLSQIFFYEGIRRNRLYIFVNNNLNARLNSRCKKRYNATILSTDITIIKSARNTHIIHNNQEEEINGEFIYMRTTSKFNITHNDIIVE